MRDSWFLGTIRGIPILVHWSFVLILGWSGYHGYQVGGWAWVPFAILLTLLLFVCVVLHELGHSLTARRFGIQTRSITLLPIGGVASLDGIPRKPLQEILIAIAGPMVNVVIALLLYLLIGWPDDTAWYAASWKLTALAGMLFYVNIVMILFNLIPAFPMDGGRILRAFLALFLSYERATAIASVIGQLLAMGMAVAGYFWNPFLSLIGLMVFLGARRENQRVQMASMPYRIPRPFVDVG